MREETVKLGVDGAGGEHCKRRFLPSLEEDITVKVIHFSQIRPTYFIINLLSHNRTVMSVFVVDNKNYNRIFVTSNGSMNYLVYNHKGNCED